MFWHHFGCDFFQCRSCLFYSSGVLPLIKHVLCKPAVMSCAPSDLDSLCGSSGSNSMKKLIPACCYELSGAADGCGSPLFPVIGKFTDLMLKSKYKKSTFFQCWTPPIRFSKCNKTRLRITFAYLTVNCVLPSYSLTHPDEMKGCLACKTITSPSFCWRVVSRNGSNCLVFF